MMALDIEASGELFVSGGEDALVKVKYTVQLTYITCIFIRICLFPNKRDAEYGRNSQSCFLYVSLYDVYTYSINFILMVVLRFEKYCVNNNTHKKQPLPYCTHYYIGLGLR